MNCYDIVLVNDHILIDCGKGLVLVDTGCPTSFHCSGEMPMGEEILSVPRTLMPVDSNYVSQNVGASVSGILGMDYLHEHDVVIDVPKRKLIVDYDPSKGDGYDFVSVPSFFVQCAGLEMEIGGRRARVLLDTGAPTSYLQPHMCNGLAAVDRVSDFSPFSLGGKFETDIYEVPASLGGLDFTLRAGNLPQDLSMMIGLLGVDGVIGMEILSRFAVRLTGDKVSVAPVEAYA